MLFIGTQNELKEKPLDSNKPDFYLERISGEFLPIKQVFKNQNIYFVGTSRGCSCDFGIQSNRLDPTSIQTPSIKNLLNKFRKASGINQEKVHNAVKEQANYLAQTLKLVDIVLNETKEGNKVEMFCVWAGDYDTAPEFHNTIDTTKTDLRETFEVAEKEFVTFV